MRKESKISVLDFDFDHFTKSEVLKAAIAVGGSTLNDFAAVDGTLGYFGHHFQVYDREDGPCLKEGCNGTIERIVQSNRSTFLCPRCQK